MPETEDPQHPSGTIASSPARAVFALPEYVSAAQQHAFSTTAALARAKSALLAEIRSETREAIPVSVSTDESGRQLEVAPAPVPIRIAVDIDPVVAGDLGPVYAALDEAAEQQEEEMTKALFAMMTSLTGFTGNTVDADGKPFSWDLIADAFEKMDISFETGKPDITLVMHPDDFAKLEKLPRPTPEQQARHDAVLARKHAEWLARQRTRRLD
jgi:hypothetical protein